MRRLSLALFLFLVTGAGLAQTTPAKTPLTLAEVLRLAPPNDPDVLSAKADVAAAQRDLTRLEADPLALKVPTLQAEQNLENAQAALESARLTSRTEATSAYFSALSADASLGIAEQDLAIEQAIAQTAQIRLEAGAATELELLQAQNTLAAAQRSQQGAEQARDLAHSELASLSGLSTNRVAQISLTPPALPALEESLSRAETSNSGVQAVATTIEVAEAQLAAVDNIFSAQTDIDAAQDTLTSVRSSLDTTRRSLELTIRDAYNTLSSAARSFANAKADFLASQDELAAQQARLDAGNLAPLGFQEAQLSHAQTKAAVYSALYTFRLAALELEQTVSNGAGGAGVGSSSSGAATNEPSGGTDSSAISSDASISGAVDSVLDELTPVDSFSDTVPDITTDGSSTP